LAGIFGNSSLIAGQVELIPGIICDGYVLDDTAVMGIIGTVKLLSVRYKVLHNIATKGIPKVLEPFIDEGLNIATKTITVVAQNSHQKGFLRSVQVANVCPHYFEKYASPPKQLEFARQHPAPVGEPLPMSPLTPSWELIPINFNGINAIKPDSSGTPIYKLLNDLLSAINVIQ
jgi:hypothetical protein